MIRLMGILTGSAIAVALLIVALGIPELATEQTMPIPTVEPINEVPPATPPTIAETPPPKPAPEAAAAQLDETIPNESLEANIDSTAAVPDTTLETPIQPDEPRPAADAGWFAFWSPFRSEIAANGFVSELQRTTGLDYRVVRLKPGVYEVAFAYSDKNDIEDKLTRISTATGLDLSGG